MNELYDVMRKKSFYFTPLGQFIIETFLFSVYLLVFTVVTHEGISIYVEFTWVEATFWILNVGYMIFELWDMLSSKGGFFGYISDWTNQFDFAISINFLVMMVIRFFTWYNDEHQQCEHFEYGVNAIPQGAFHEPTEEEAYQYTEEDLQRYCFVHDGKLWEPYGLSWLREENVDNTINCGDEYNSYYSAANVEIMDECSYENCCADTALNMGFSVLWVLAVIFLYIR